MGLKKIKIVTVIIIACLLFQTYIVTAGSFDQTTSNKYVDTFQGSFSVPRRGRYTVSIYYPSYTSVKPYPVIVFAHGFCSCGEWHSWIGNCLARNGFIALLFTVPNRTSTDVLQWVDGIEGGIRYLQQMNNESNQFSGMMNMSRLGVMGHSMGAMASIIVASKDSRIKAVVSLAAPYMKNKNFDDESAKELKSEIDWDSVLSASYKITIPAQFQVGTLDAFAADNAEIYFTAVNSSSKEFIAIEGGNHVQFIDDDSILTRSAYYGLLSLFQSMNQATILSLYKYVALNIVLLVSKKTLIEAAVAIGIDQPATITPQELQKISSQNFLSFLNRYL